MAKQQKSLKISDMTDAQRKSIGQRVVKLRKAGNGWPEIMEATGIAGGLTGRKLMREFGGKQAESLIRPSYTRTGGTSTTKRAKKATSSTRGRSTSRSTKATTTKTRNKGKSSRARAGSRSK